MLECWAFHCGGPVPLTTWCYSTQTSYRRSTWTCWLGLWTLRSVEYIHGAKTLFKPTTRFHGVFTKLQAWTLTDYERVLFLDLDLLVRRNVDDLFQLRPPAAMWAKGGQKHGEAIDAPPPFKGYHSVEPWGKSGCVRGLSGLSVFRFRRAKGRPGWFELSKRSHVEPEVNAGVILLEPDLEVFEHMREGGRMR